MAQVSQGAKNAVSDQKSTLTYLLKTAEKTAFGQDHQFSQINTHAEYCQQVPIRDYEELRPYFEQVVAGEKNILWPGKPTYLAKTSGTTSGVKYIPMTKASTPHHVITARDALFAYVRRKNSAKFFNGKMIYLSGSPILTETNGIATGRLSGIVNHQIPNWIKGNKLPKKEVNVIDDWETKVKAMATESIGQDVTLIGGIPPWVQMYYEEVLAQTGAGTVAEVFPNLSVFVYGGVNFEPYRSKLESLVGKSLDTIETYPASEGFLAYQDASETEGLLLNTNAGIFYEFVDPSEMFSTSARRLTLAEVELGVNYAIILSTNAGLWAYAIGDTVEFIGLNPYRLRVTGRVKHFISAFGEHVIGKEVDQAMIAACQELGITVNEFTVAPQVSPTEGLPYHEWLVASSEQIADQNRLANLLDLEVQRQNTYYRDLIEGKVLRPAVVTMVGADAFRRYMQSQGKLGGQNKVPRLANDRKIADLLIADSQRT